MIINGEKIMCKAVEVGKIVVNKCLDLNLEINTQKLQKLLSLMQAECIRRSKKQLFKEDIVVWDCGVAIKEVDSSFKIYGQAFTEKLIENIALLEKENECVNFILNKYGRESALDLNKLEDNQKIISLGVKSEVSATPHISYQILLGVFG